MAYQEVDIGTVADDGTGDPLRTAFNKINENFTETYGFIRCGTKVCTAGSNTITFTSAFGSTNYEIMLIDYTGIGVEVTTKNTANCIINALGAGTIGYIAILNL